MLNHGADVVIPKIAQDDQADYEGELVSLFPANRVRRYNAFLFSFLLLYPTVFIFCTFSNTHYIQCVVIGKDAKDVSEWEAMEYVAGYTAGNDISSRKLQRDPALAGTVPQWGFSKGFDTWAPLGPAIISRDLITDPSALKLTTTIDGQVRQSSGLDDLLFSVPYLISYLSTGTTLEKGSIIMTGTPGGKLRRITLS